MDIIKTLESEQIRKELPFLEIGDFVKVFLKIKEGTRERLQAFEGTVISKRGEGVNESFTVRRVTYGVGVERVLPVHSPKIDHIDVVRKGKVRRAKLYYLRDKVGKSARLKTKLQPKAKKTAQNEPKEEETSQEK
ncbi:MAG: 50S ribosomal protein L19 [Eubacteriales bacterium]|nr:50S ribosomal protein L19 [Eubacteriales bacterium]